MRGRRRELWYLALDGLRRLGYTISSPPSSHLGENVRHLSKDGEGCLSLIQVRAHQIKNKRYLVGIILPDLAEVEQCVIWFEHEDFFLKMPADELLEIHEEERRLGRTGYAHGNRQWRVDILLSEGAISPQGSRGRRIDVSSYLLPTQTE